MQQADIDLKMYKKNFEAQNHLHQDFKLKIIKSLSHYDIMDKKYVCLTTQALNKVYMPGVQNYTG